MRRPCSRTAPLLLALPLLLLLTAWPSPAGVVQYDYDAALDTPANNTWEDEQANPATRDWTFNAASSPVAVVSPGTSLTQAYDFDGGTPNRATTNTYDGSALDPGGNTDHPVAWEFWARPENTSFNQVIFETGGNTRGGSLLLEGSVLTYATIGNPSDTRSATYDIGGPTADLIQIVGVTDTAGSNQTRLYVNGQLKSATDQTRRWNRGTNNAGLGDRNGDIGGLTGGAQSTFISSGAGGSDVSFDGKMARLRFYSGDTSAQDVYKAFRELAPSQADPYADEALADAPIALYRLNEPAGQTTAANQGSIGSAVSGTHAGSGTITLETPGLIATGDDAADFDGSSYVAIPDNGQINTNGPYPNKTVELWFDADTVPAGNTAADVDMLYEQGGAGNGLNVFLLDGTLHAGTWRGGNRDFIAAPGGITPGQTHHVMLTHDGPNNRLVGYVNGAPFDAVTGGVPALPNHVGDIAIGGVDDDSRFAGGEVNGTDVNHYDGTMDEVSLYNDTLTIRRIQEHFVAGGGDVGVTAGATLGVTLNYDASKDTTDNDTWEDTVGTAGSFDWSVSPGTLSGVAAGGSDVSLHPGIDSAYAFSGSDSGTMSSLESLPVNPTGAAASFEAWLRPADNDSQLEVIFETGGGIDGLSLLFDDATNEVVFRALDDGDSNKSAEARFDLDLVESEDWFFAGESAFDEFVQIVGVVDPATDSASLFVNSLPRAADMATGNLSDWAGGNGSGLGAANSGTNLGGTSPFTGDIALLRFYDWALTRRDVDANFFAVTGTRIPEPATLALLGLASLGLARRRRSR